MELLFPGLAIFGAATYLTSLVCCFELCLGWKPRWYSVLLGAIGTGALTWLFYQGGAARAPLGHVPYASGFAFTVGLIPAWYVVGHFRERHTAGRRSPGLRRGIGFSLGIAGAAALVVGVVLWLNVPAGAAEQNPVTATAVMLSVKWFLVGAGLSACGFHVGLQDTGTTRVTRRASAGELPPH
jgi:hypothetical protein